ncbi:MAG: hypothetical protein GF315_00585 [candidate division Zixibacteria bacterium]|nr:hypothetical protein [candidate division Zixibacteria bacterium]
MRASKVRTGLLLIGTGLILLGNTLGYLNWFVWEDLLRLWPVLLIAIGVEMIFKRSKLPALAYISPILIAGCFIYAVYGGGALADNGDSVEKNESLFAISNEQVKDLKSLDIDIDCKLGDFKFESTDNEAFKGEFEYYGPVPKFEFSSEDGIGRIELKYRDNKVKFKGLHRDGCDSYIYITDQKPVSLTIDAGVVDLDIDLRDVETTEFDLDTGVSDVVVHFGDKSHHIDSNFDIGVSDLTIYIPERTAVRLHKDVGLSSVSYKHLGLEKIKSGLYQSPNYDSAQYTIDIDIDAGISDIDIKYYSAGRTEL